MKFQELSSIINEPIFSRHEIILAGGKIFDYQLTRWVGKGYLLKLKNGIYAFARDFERISGEQVATAIYQPSYLSLESALSFYGFIPEIVYSYVSVTGKINRTFDNKFGHFIYRHLKSALYWGYHEMKTDTGRYLIADPEKAVLDYLYLNLSKINSESDFNNLRFNQDQLNSTLKKNKFLQYLQVFKIKKLNKWAHRCLP